MKINNYKKFLLEKSNKLKPDVLLDFPEFRQTFNFDCGITSIQQVLIYYGMEKNEDELIEMLGGKKKEVMKNGLPLSEMRQIFEYFGLEIEIKKNTSISELKEIIKDGIPPILMIQAWRNKDLDNLNWSKDYKDSHFVIAIGYNDNCIFFEDPASVNRTFLTYEELEDRWHDLADDNKTKISKVAIIVKGEKKYSSKNIIHMD